MDSSNGVKWIPILEMMELVLCMLNDPKIELLNEEQI
jgi:hypothetical protein